MQAAYVTAIQHYLDTGMEPDAVLTALKRVMATRGHEDLLPAVLRAVVREREASRSVRTVVRVPNNQAYQQLKNVIADTLTSLTATSEPVVTFDETLIGGYQVEVDGTRVDASHKQHLLTLYRSITNHTT